MVESKWSQGQYLEYQAAVLNEVRNELERYSYNQDLLNCKIKVFMSYSRGKDRTRKVPVEVRWFLYYPKGQGAPPIRYILGEDNIIPSGKDSLNALQSDELAFVLMDHLPEEERTVGALLDFVWDRSK